MSNETLNPILTIAIIGAGYSGLATLLNLYSLTKRPLRILLCEKKKDFALGLAYSTDNLSHLLNVPAGNMSAFADIPDHFIHWLQDNKREFSPFFNVDDTNDIRKQFIPRYIYGQYLQSLLKHLLTNKPTNQYGLITQIELHQAEVINIVKEKNQVQLLLAHDKCLKANKVVLAYGNLEPRDLLPFAMQRHGTHYIHNPWNHLALNNIDQNNNIAIVGTGLTMIDTVLRLEDQGHRGTIYALSRRGLLPQVHQYYHQPHYTIHYQSLPNTMLALLRHIRRTIKVSQHQGLDWRVIIDSLRPHTQGLWQTFTIKEKQQFIRYLLPYWDTHRHRVAPTVAQRINKLCASQQLKIIKGNLLSVEDRILTINSRARKSLSKDNNNKHIKITAEYVINCTGPNTNLKTSKHRLIQSLIRQGLISLDTIGLGIEISNNCAVIPETGVSSDWLFAIGPICKSKLWECIAVPDIRKQARDLALHLTYPN